MIDDYPNTLGTIVYHLNAPYASAFGDTRWNTYGGYWIPHSVHDGSYDAWPYTTYESKFLARQQVTTDVTIDMTVFPAGNVWSVVADVCVEPGGAGKDMVVWMAQVLDNYGSSYLPRNGARTGSNGVTVTVAAGACATVRESFALDAPSLGAPDDIKFFVWAQDPDWVPDTSMPPATFYWAEIYQANKAIPPFNEGMFYDGFESGDTSIWAGVVQ